MKVTEKKIAAHLISADWEAVVIANSWREIPGEPYRETSLALSTEDFAVEVHRRVWRVMAEISGDGRYPRMDVVADELDRQGKLDTVGGLTGIVNLDGRAIPGMNLDGVCKLLKRKSIDRRRFDLSEKLNALYALKMSSTSEEVTTILAELKELETARLMQPDQHTRSFADCLEEEGGLQTLLTPPKNRIAFPWAPSPVPGFEPGQFIVIGGRPSMGKTVIGAQIALKSAKTGAKTLFASLEMSRGEMLKRFLSPESGVANTELQEADRLTKQDRERITDAAERINALPLEIAADIRKLDQMEALLTQAERVGDRYRMLVIDYLGLIDAGRTYENRTAEVSAISRRLKVMAAEHQCALVAMAQLNRGERGQENEPQLNDLRDSGSIEQDADIVMFIHRPGYYKTNQPELKNVARLVIRKNRNGPVGLVHLVFDPEHCQFKPLERFEDEY